MVEIAKVNSRHNLVLGLAKSFVFRINEIYSEKTPLNRDTVDDIVSTQYNLYKKRHDSRIYFGLETEYLEPKYIDNLSLHIIKVIANLTSAIKKQDRNINLLLVQKTLNQYLNNSDVPQWLREKLHKHLPPLFIKELSISKDNHSDDKNKYYVFSKRGNTLELNSNELNHFYDNLQTKDYDIFIENTEKCRILIFNNPDVFRAGKYHAFSILNLFLQRLGKDISYNEIYHLAIKPVEKSHPKDRSKKVYDYLKRIDKKVEQVKNKKQLPEKWFSRIHKKGIVKISENINSCLLVSLDNLVY